MKKLITVFVVLVLIAACVLGFFSYERKREDKSNTDIISQTDLFDVNGDEVAIIYDYSLQGSKGISKSGEAYIPISWINDYINNKFYWDSSIDAIIYTLPDDIEYFRLSDESGASVPRFISQNGEIYLSLEFVASRSSIYFMEYLNDQANRVYINDSRDTYETASVTRDTMLRTGQSDLQRGITELNDNDIVTVIKDDENGWSRVLTSTGFPGYIETECLGDRKSNEPVISYSSPVYSHILMDEEIVLVWQQLESQSSNDTLPQLLDRTEGVNVVSPTWFFVLDDKGTIKSLASHDYVNYAHENNIKVWALVNNFSTNVHSTDLLSSSSARQNLINQMISKAREYEIDGINVDFENLEENCASHFIEFIRELSVSCRKEGLVLSVDNPNMQPFNIFYGRGDQAECVDYVINMGYDEHYAGGDAGSVASLPFVDEGLQGCLSEVPAGQLINGIPFYTRIWNIDNGDVSSQAVGLDTAAKWIKDNHVDLSWDDELGQNYGQYRDHFIWMEDNDSLKAKIDLGRSYNLAGIAAWKLGMESRETWEVFKKE
ncbi:MAG: glycosyl hydrolase family 18 protein [Lachnospiraceae bacterium]|nr:glycosyl hydrolase family 18 protein [Lachnospiraceae bacterium]